MRVAAIVLAGGSSTRMGEPKAMLDRDGVPFVTHVTAVARAAVAPGPVVVSAGQGQELPALPTGVAVVRDRGAGLGPLEGFRAGLHSLTGRADAVLVLSTDLPLVRPELGRRLLRLLEEGGDAVVPVAHGHRHPLAAAYRVELAALVDDVLATGSGKAGLLLERCVTRFVTADDLLADPELAAADPALESLVNVNTPAELAAARAQWRAHERSS